jgi:hypothetical protein
MFLRSDIGYTFLNRMKNIDIREVTMQLTHAPYCQNEGGGCEITRSRKCKIRNSGKN